MKDYELTVLFHPDLEMNLDPAVDKVKKIIESTNGKIEKEENDGKKRLAYPVKGESFALYYYFDVKLPPEAPSKIGNVLNITDETLRHLLVRADGRRVKEVAQDKDETSEEEKVITEEKGE